MKNDTSFGPDARTVAAIFVDMQEQRHAADYDPGYRVGPIEVSAILARAEQALDLLNGLAPAERALIAARLIGRTRA